MGLGAEAHGAALVHLVREGGVRPPLSCGPPLSYCFHNESLRACTVTLSVSRPAVLNNHQFNSIQLRARGRQRRLAGERRAARDACPPLLHSTWRESHFPALGSLGILRYK